MPDTLSNLNLPLLAPSQAQKHVTHNEALRILDTLTQLVVLSDTLDTPRPLRTRGSATLFQQVGKPIGPVRMA